MSKSDKHPLNKLFYNFFRAVFSSFFRTVFGERFVKFFRKVSSIFFRTVFGERFIKFFRKAFEKVYLPALSLFIVILLTLGIILIVYNAEREKWRSFEIRAAWIAIAFGFLALVSWLLSLLIYKEVRVYIGNGGQLLMKARESISMANHQIKILALAPNIGQAFFISQFDKFSESFTETLHRNENLKIEFITLKRGKICTLLSHVGESHLRKKRSYSDQKKIISIYRKKANDFFTLLRGRPNAAWWTIPLAGKIDPIKDARWKFTAIVIDEAWAGIITNTEPYDGFECKNAYEIRVILAAFEMLKKQGSSVEANDVLPHLDVDNEWTPSP